MKEPASSGIDIPDAAAADAVGGCQFGDVAYEVEAPDLVWSGVPLLALGQGSRERETDLLVVSDGRHLHACLAGKVADHRVDCRAILKL